MANTMSPTADNQQTVTTLREEAMVVTRSTGSMQNMGITSDGEKIIGGSCDRGQKLGQYNVQKRTSELAALLSPAKPLVVAKV